MNIMYDGESTSGVKFFNLLFKNNEFCSELGKVSLAAGKLEAHLINFLRNKGVSSNLERATLCRLIGIAKNGEHISNNIFISLDIICKQRNYLTHNIYSLFIELIDETILKRENLLDSDVEVFIVRARDLQENINNLAMIIESRC